MSSQFPLFRTPVELPDSPPILSASTRVVLLGSCFAIHMGDRLSVDLGNGQCCVNPFGALYNPRSIFGALLLLMAGEEEMDRCLPDALFEGRDGLWHSWLFSTQFSHPTAEGALRLMRKSVAQARGMLFGHGEGEGKEPAMLVLTFGTDHHYRLNEGEGGRVVANCHKEPAARFTEIDDEVGTLEAEFEHMFGELLRRSPGIKLVLTVSPYRYRKYGFHESQLSKARLLLLCHTACKAHPQSVHYFPAYEILNDELRDYRFYDADMLHPSAQAVTYIAERFEAWCYDDSLRALAEARRKTYKREQHRQISASQTI